MPHIKFEHVLLISVMIVPYIILAYTEHSVLPTFFISMWLVFPCRDKQFGYGRKFFWLRQTTIIIGFLIGIVVGNL